MPPPAPIRLETAPFRQGSALAAMARLVPLAGARIVDAGANKGRTVETLLALYPDASLVAYEPHARLARKLAKRYAGDHRVRVRQAALGDGQGQARLYVPMRATCSSLLRPLGPFALPNEATAQDTPVVRLDQELTDAPHLIKIDVQGFELHALRGAGRLLENVLAVVAEVAFLPRYAGQPLARELGNWLAAKGFRLEGLYDPIRDEAGRLAAANGLFLRETGEERRRGKRGGGGGE